MPRAGSVRPQGATAPWRRVLAPAALAAVLLSGAVSSGVAHASGTAPTSGTAPQVKAAVDASVRISRLTPTQAASLSSLGLDNASHRYKLPSSCATATQCAFGDTSSTRVVVLFGDSHARMWLSAIIPAATAAQVRLVVIGEDGCPIAEVTWSGPLANCAAARERYVAVINAMHPYAVILSNRTSFPRISQAAWQQGMTETIESLAPSKAKVALIGDLQVIRRNPPQCLAAYASSVQRCTEVNPNLFQAGHEKAELAAATATKSLYVNPQPWLCTPHKCVPVIGKYFAYWDSYHVSDTYAAYLSTVMGAALKPVL